MERAKTISEIVASFLRDLWKQTPRNISQKDMALRLNKSESFVSVLLSGRQERLQKQKFNSICEFVYVLDPESFTENMSDLMSLIYEELQKSDASKKDE